MTSSIGARDYIRQSRSESTPAGDLPPTADGSDDVSGPSNGISAYLAKPLSIHELGRTVREVLDRGGARHSPDPTNPA